MSLRILAVGGTFEKVYNPLTGELTFTATCLPGILAQARTCLPVQVVMLVDSLDMTDDDRDAVLLACREADEPRLVIVHGTDTLVDTAAWLAAAKLPKTIVLTGAMVPHAIEASDATFNLGYAVGAAHQLDNGVWVAMNGQVHRWDRVHKNREIGRFEATPVAPGETH